MNQLPRVIKNPLIGDTVTFIKTAEETNGAYTVVEVELAPNGGNGMHYHLDFDEMFEVVDGVLGIQLGKEIMHLQPGQSAVAVRKAVHRFFNPSTMHPVKFLCTITPAMQFEQMLRIAYGLANDGLTNKKGMPSILPLSIMFQKGGTYLPNMPAGMQRAMFNFIARIARRRGVDKALEKYYNLGRYNNPLYEILNKRH